MRKYSVISFLILLILGISGIGLAKLPLKLSVPKSDIKFSHESHVGQQEIECDACHASVETSTSSADKNLPTMDDCGDCHEVEDDEECGSCHRDVDDPMELLNPERELIFSHQKHLGMKTDCGNCHAGIETSAKPDPVFLPKMKTCFECHDGTQASNDCAICHSSNLTLADIHPIEWRHLHGESASSDPESCRGCHGGQEYCLDCHRGDNLTGRIHDLNYVYTHGLDAGSNATDCSHCHENQVFCVDCHDRGNRMPLNHSSLSWGVDHGRYARDDVENCASCHESGDPTCARGGCHNDFDGIRGTDTRIHGADTPQFDFAGPWHDDDGYYCYQCHVSTRSSGGGFCEYCHN